MLKIVYKYLALSGYSKIKDEYESLFYSHPNYPSLFAVTDSLDLLSIENIAARIDKSKLNDLPNLFLAFITTVDGSEIVLIEKRNDTILVENEKNIKTRYSTDDFIAVWDGTIIAVEPNVVNKAAGNNKMNYLRYTFFYLVVYGAFIYKNGFNWIESFFFFSSTIGLFVSFFIIQEKLGVPSEIVSKICTGLKSNCDSVIKSKNSNINRWLSFSDFPILFFGINGFSLILTVSSINYIGIFSVLSIPVLVYSIWLQKQKLKTWCALCLITVSIIFLQSIVFVFYVNFQTVSNSSFYYFFSIVSISTFWLYIKPIIERKIKTEKQVSELIRFKRNYKLFQFLSKKINSIDGFDTLQGIHFGNQEASVELTLIISPSCIHCHKAFQDANALLNKYPQKIKLHVLFNLNPENRDNPHQLVVQNLLAISYYREEDVLQAITDWHINNLDLDIWLKKWGGNRISFDVERQIQLQYNWCLANNFNYTPVKIINNNVFPDEYEISELKYFIPDFIELKAEENKVIAEAI